MNNLIQESDLILNPDGSVYHLNLLPDEIANTVILVGDPDRVQKISKHFDSIEVKKQKREFVTHTGYCNGARLTVLSTGIGPGNIDIAINELDALVNIDLKSRTIKKQLKQLNLVRFGTTGALQPEIPVDSFIVSEYAVGFDVVSHYYQFNTTDEEKSITDALIQHLQPSLSFLSPYILKGSSKLINLFQKTCVCGITATSAGFYAPQGRQLRYKAVIPDFMDQLAGFNYDGKKITNLEMETSTIYGIGKKTLNHNCCAINLAIVNRPLKTHSKTAAESMEKMIKMGLKTLSNYEKSLSS